MKLKSLSLVSVAFAFTVNALPLFAQPAPIMPQNLSIDYNQHRRTTPSFARAARSASRNLGKSNTASNRSWAISDAVSNLGWAGAAINHDWVWGPVKAYSDTVNAAGHTISNLANPAVEAAKGVISIFTAPPPPMPQ